MIADEDFNTQISASLKPRMKTGKALTIEGQTGYSLNKCISLDM